MIDPTSDLNIGIGLIKMSRFDEPTRKAISIMLSYGAKRVSIVFSSRYRLSRMRRQIGAEISVGIDSNVYTCASFGFDVKWDGKCRLK